MIEPAWYPLSPFAKPPLPTPPPSSTTISAIAELCALIGDTGRANMLMALLDGPPLAARQLAACAGVTPQTASGHLAKLIAAGMVSVERRGRHRYHKIASPEIAHLLRTLRRGGSHLRPKGRLRLVV